MRWFKPCLWRPVAGNMNTKLHLFQQLHTVGYSHGSLILSPLLKGLICSTHNPHYPKDMDMVEKSITFIQKAYRYSVGVHGKAACTQLTAAPMCSGEASPES